MLHIDAVLKNTANRVAWIIWKAAWRLYVDAVLEKAREQGRLVKGRSPSIQAPKHVVEGVFPSCNPEGRMLQA